MLVILLLLISVIVIICGPRLSQAPMAENSYLSRERSCFIKGLLINAVMLWHIELSIPRAAGDIGGTIAIGLFSRLGHCVFVAPFLFFSGYGLMLNFLSKNKTYLKSIVFCRIPTLVVHFEIVIFLYFAVRYWLGIGGDIHVADLITAMLAWESVGNVNWYVFVIVVLYALFSLIFSLLPRGWAVLLLTIVSLLSAVTFLMFGKPWMWYLTEAAFPCGVLYAWRKDSIERLLFSDSLTKRLLLSVGLLGLALMLYNGGLCFDGDVSGVLLANFGCAVSVVAIALLNSCVRLRRYPRFLIWCGGKGLFALLIVHGLPRTVLSHYGWNAHWHPFVFICVSYAAFIFSGYMVSMMWRWIDAGWQYLLCRKAA